MIRKCFLFPLHGKGSGNPEFRNDERFFPGDRKFLDHCSGITVKERVPQFSLGKFQFTEKLFRNVPG